MKQIITGPFGRVAYHSTAHSGTGQYPTLNMPCREFARGTMPVAANDAYAANVVPLARTPVNRAMVARFGLSANR